MTTPMLMTQHPTEEVLAAYVDDQLDSAARSEVTEHLVSCGECREIVLMATEYQANEASNVRQGSFGRPWLAAAALAVAASIAVIVVKPVRVFGPNVEDLVAASRGLSTRPSMGRLAGDFAYSDAPSIMRGGREEKEEGARWRLLRMRLDVEEAIFPNSHVRGLTLLLTAEKGKEDPSAAVSLLESAYEKARGEERDSIAIDLAAALIAYASWSNQPHENYSRALDLSNDVLKRNPASAEALWNRATALDRLNRNSEATWAWDAYLKVDPNSQWSEEAKRHKALLQ
ncbi:MAG: zf-HC2 domain-containing protein [Acidobacteriota bacterium]|nr:zf-HC2 domain-containing protein [Acidobacteriota bacterium]